MGGMLELTGRVKAGRKSLSRGKTQDWQRHKGKTLWDDFRIQAIGYFNPKLRAHTKGLDTATVINYVLS